MDRKFIHRVRKVVIKIGTSVLTGDKNFIEREKIERIACDVKNLSDKSINACLVSSGAISCGMSILGLDRRPKNLPQLQATAAVGQRKLMDFYADAFSKYKLQVAQILLTQDDFKDRRRYLNARNTIITLWEKNIVPIVNENDTVAVDEIRFGDNDKLSAKVASLLDAGLLIILSDVDGLRDKDKLIKIVEEITPGIENAAGGTDKEISVGGMATKLEAAKIVRRAGIPCIIANGNQSNIIEKIMEGQDLGTLFVPRREKLAARKQWMTFNLRPQGKLHIDKGATEALLAKGKSLLATGIVFVEGKFKEADLVSIIDAVTKNEIGCGITNYSCEELNKIKGFKTAEIEKTLGYKYYDEVIHRDNLSLL